LGYVGHPHGISGEQISELRQRIWEWVLLSLPKRPDILAIQLGAGLILLVLLAGVMFIAPPLQVAVAVASILVIVYFFTRPLIALFAVFVLRAVLDLLWWIPGTLLGLNMLQLFSASVFVLVSTQLFLELKRVQNHPCFKLMLVYLLLMGIATVRCDDIPRNVDSIVRYTSPLFLLLMVSLYFDEERHRIRLLQLIAVVGLLPLTVSVYHYTTGQMGAYELHGYSRLLGGYKNLHNMALMTLFFITLYVFWFSRARNLFGALVLTGIIGVSCFVLFQTYIRTGMLGLAVFGTAYLVVLRRYRTLGVLGFIAVAFLVTNISMQDRFSDLMLVFDTENISLDKRRLGSGRWGIWTMSMREYLGGSPWNLILGAGLGGQRAMTLDWVKLFHSKHITLDPHNDMLLLLYQIGPIGVLTYLGFQWQVFRHARDLLRGPGTSRLDNALGAFGISLTVMVLVTNCVSNSFVHRTSPGWYYWCIAGLIFAQHKSLVQRRMRANPDEGLRLTQPAV
jgi:O-antigen ligase